MTGRSRIGVVGAGVMGTAIAALAVGHGVDVVLADTDDEALGRAPAEVRRHLRTAELMGARRPGGAEGELHPADSVGALAGVTAVVEAVTEVPRLKAAVLAEIDAATEPGTLLLTNTSAIPVDELAAAVSRPEDLVGAHFMNPPYLIRTVEVVRGPRSGAAAVTATRVLMAELDREPVIVGDGPGFVVNRVLQRVLNEAARIVEDGIAAPADVDALFQGCLGHRTGPLATADLIGLDNVVDSLAVLHERTGDPGYAPCALLLRKLRDGDLGRKSGRGFFDYGKADRP